MSVIVNLKISVSLKIHRVYLCVHAHIYIGPYMYGHSLCLFYKHTEKNTSLVFLPMSSLYISVN